MRHEDDLAAGMIRIGKGEGQGVEKDGRRFIKGYAVLFDVGLCLRGVPLIDHSFSLLQLQESDPFQPLAREESRRSV